MGILDDFGDIFKEITDIRQDITKEFTGIRKDVTDSMVDIDQGIKRKKESVKQQITHPFSSTSNFIKPVDTKPDSGHFKIEVK